MEEPKSKREHVDEEHQLMSPKEKKKTLQDSRHSFEKENSGGKALNEGQNDNLGAALEKRKPQLKINTKNNIKVSGLSTHRAEASLDLSKYDFLYQARSANPNFYKKDDNMKDISDRMRKESMKHAKNWLNLDFTEWYTKIKRQYTKKFIATIETNQELIIKRIQVSDIMEKLQIDTRGDCEKLLKMIFVKRQEDSAAIECYVGMETQSSPVLLQTSQSAISSISDDSNAGNAQYSIFNTMINLE